MPPSPFSLFLAENLDIKKDVKTAIDIGCGSGFLSIVLAQAGVNRIYAVDIDDRCIKATIENAKINGVADQIIPIKRDIFDNLDFGIVDLAVSNPPTKPPFSSIHIYRRGIQERGNFLEYMIKIAPSFVKQGGEMQFVCSSLLNIPYIEKILSETGYTFEIVRQMPVQFRSFYFSHLEYFEDKAKSGEAEILKIEDDFYELVSFFKCIVNNQHNSE